MLRCTWRQWLVSCVLAASLAPFVHAQTPVSWWPDPHMGIMWNADTTMFSSGHRTFAGAEAVCADSRALGYANWRLPTAGEVDSATENYSVENPQGWGRELTRLKFMTLNRWPIWTTTLGANGNPLQKGFDPPQATFETKPGQTGSPSYCVRTMEPALLALAREAHPNGVVTSMTQLQSIALLVEAESSIDQDNFPAALTLVRQSLALEPESAQAYQDMGMAQGYQGQFAEALGNFAKAHTLSKSWDAPKDATRTFNRLEKESAADPRALPAWILVHDADVALMARKFAQALDDAAQVIQQEPTWPQGYHRRGQALMAEFRQPEAIVALKQAVALDKGKETTAVADLKQLQGK